VLLREEVADTNRGQADGGPGLDQLQPLPGDYQTAMVIDPRHEKGERTMRIPEEVRDPLTWLRDLAKNVLNDLEQGGDDQDYDVVAFEEDLNRLQSDLDALFKIIKKG
jgi:hypothetical protein